MILKTVYLIWFNDNKEIPSDYFNSVKEKLKDYQIIVVGKDNYTKYCNNEYANELRVQKAWVQLSNYLRFYLLYNNGGIYIDTDVEMLKTFDELLDNKLFAGFEDNEYVNNAVLGSERHHPIIKECLSHFHSANHDALEKGNIKSPILFTDVLKKHGLMQNGKTQKIERALILDKTYFYPYTYDTVLRSSDIKENTICVHHWMKSWH